MKTATFFFLATALFLGSTSNTQAAAPATPTAASYTNWLNSIGSKLSPFSDMLFSWYESDTRGELPAAVAADPEKMFVTVDRPLAETIELEDLGDVEKGCTFGMEMYALIDAPVDTVLGALMFKWGRPIGGTFGTTYPMDTVYGARQETLSSEWGEMANVGTKSKGGVAKPVFDKYNLVLRGNSDSGYTLFGQFHAPAGRANETTTQTSMSIVHIRPAAGGKTAYFMSARHVGQSYLFFGIEQGRKNFGFNRERIRQGLKEFISSVDELKRTGKIVERRP